MDTKAIDAVVAAGPFDASWESLEDCAVPKWYLDAKFGIFIHWGAYSVPAFGSEWYPRQMYLKDSAEFKHHVETYGPHAQFGHKDFIPLFKGERFDAAAWAELFREAGAKFVVPVAEHHDGFAMYDCDLSPWCATRMGPMRDVIGELAAAVRKEKMTFGLSSHRAEHWWFFNGGTTFDSDVRDLRNATLYGPAAPDNTPPDALFLNDWLLRTCELVDKYRPQLVWFDWWIEQAAFKPYLQRFGAYYYNRAAAWKKGVAINYKNLAFPEKAAVLDLERGQLAGIRPLYWQNDTSVSRNSWGHIRNQDYKTPGALIGDLVDVVSKNGSLLLNVAPRADGTIPGPEQTILREIGRWLSVNGEAIYRTRPWKVFGEGPTEVPEGMFTDSTRSAFTSKDIRFTKRGRALYAIVLAWPRGGKVTVTSLAAGSGLARKPVTKVELLGSKTAPKWTQTRAGLSVQLPKRKPCDHAFVLKIS